MFRGAGTLRNASDGLKRILDLRPIGIQRNEIVWISLPVVCAGEASHIVGQIGYTSDYRRRDGIIGLVMSVPDAVLARNGYGGPSNTIERLYSWFAAECVSQADGKIDFDKAGDVLGRLGFADAGHEELGKFEPLKLKLPRSWQNYIHISQLLEILPMQVDIGDIQTRGFVLRALEGQRFDHEISENFLASWRENLLGPRERDKLVAAVEKTYKGLKQREQELELAQSQTKQVSEVARSYERQLSDARSTLSQEKAAREALQQQMRVASAELDRARQAAADAAAARDQTARTLEGIERSRSDALEALRRVEAALSDRDSRLAELDRALRTARSDGASLAEKKHQAEIGALRTQLEQETAQLRKQQTDLVAVARQAADKAKALEADRDHWQGLADRAQLALGETGSRGPVTRLPAPPRPSGDKLVLLNPKRSISGLMSTLALSLASFVGGFYVSEKLDRPVSGNQKELEQKVTRLEADLYVAQGRENDLRRDHEFARQATDKELARERADRIAERQRHERRIAELGQPNEQVRSLLSENSVLRSDSEGLRGRFAEKERELAEAKAELNRRRVTQSDAEPGLQRTAEPKDKQSAAEIAGANANLAMGTSGQGSGQHSDARLGIMSGGAAGSAAQQAATGSMHAMGPPPAAGPTRPVAADRSSEAAGARAPCGLDTTHLTFLSTVESKCAGKATSPECSVDALRDIILDLKNCKDASPCDGVAKLQEDNPFRKANVSNVRKVMNCVLEKASRQ